MTEPGHALGGRIGRRALLGLAGLGAGFVGYLGASYRTLWPDTGRTGAVAKDNSSVPPTGESALPGTMLLGRPAGTSIALSYLSAEPHEIVIEYGPDGGAVQRSAALPHRPGQPATLTLGGLHPARRYRYRVLHRRPGDHDYSAAPWAGFQTARAPGEPFVFTIQADAHRDDNSNFDVYRQTLRNIRADQPDFHIDLGDSFMCDKFARSNDDVVKRYVEERDWYATFSDTVPLFLVNGNHEGESGWDLNGTEHTLPIWAARARLRYYLNPAPDGFYTGDPVTEPLVGQRASYYAWQWGSAQFIVLDPFWFTKTKPRSANDLWGWTLGERQYRWLEQTLAASTAQLRFVFIHHLVGGIDPSARGGAEAARLWEWGGRGADGALAFGAKRPGWPAPIHDLLVKHRVSAVFHGHDHVYVQQMLDGIVYQEVPQPSHLGENGAQLAAEGSYRQGTILSSSGHLRVTVEDERATVEYVKSIRGGSTIAHSYVI